MGDAFPRFVGAVVQASPVFLDREATLEKAERLLESAVQQGARLVVFPETWVPGYPFWYNFVSRWNYTPAKQAYARLYANAVEVPGPACDALGRMARRFGVYLVMGVHERVPSGTLYNTLLFFGPDGSLLGRHRKLVPTFHERMVWAHGDGSTLQVYATEVGRLGGLICWEHWMPLARYALYAQGLQVSASVWPTAGETFLLGARHMAHEGRCFLLVSCTYMTKEDLPPDFELLREMEGAPPILSRGGSALIGPDGKFLAGPVYDREAVLTAEMDLRRIYEEKQTLDVVGHYARPEVFTLRVERRPFLPLEEDRLPAEVGRLARLADQGEWEAVRQGLRRLAQALGEGPG